MGKITFSAALLVAAIAFPAAAEPDYFWGLALGGRIASVPYVGADERSSDFVPYLFAETDYFRLEQMGITWRGWRTSYGELGVVARYRFLDLPEALEGVFNGETLDYGLQWQGPLLDSGYHYRLEWLTERYGRQQGIAEIRNEWRWQGLTAAPFVGLRFRDSAFTSKYYGLDLAQGDAGVDLQAGLSGRWKLWRSLYLYGDARLRYLGDSAAELATIDDRWQSEYSLGLAFFNEPDGSKASTAVEPGRHYWRLAHGWATPSDLGEILTFDTVSDTQDNQLTSLFYGYRLGRELFGSDVDIYFTPGVVYHHSSDVQRSGTEYVSALKFYWTWNWPTRWRLGLAEGLSYVSKITWIERVEMEEKGYTPSKLMNYLDLSLDLNIGDLIGQPSLNRWWLGYGIHHRSAVFETATQFGNIKGGSNYQTLYLQWDF